MESASAVTPTREWLRSPASLSTPAVSVRPVTRGPATGSEARSRPRFPIRPKGQCPACAPPPGPGRRAARARRLLEGDMSTGPMDCNELVELVTAYLDGALDPETH